jgi:hypothetical protein
MAGPGVGPSHIGRAGRQYESINMNRLLRSVTNCLPLAIIADGTFLLWSQSQM